MTTTVYRQDYPENSFDPDRVFAIVPALDEEATIAGVVTSLRSYGVNVCVVDNGSSDRTAAVAEATGALVIREPIRGYGRACWTGWQQIPDHCDWVLFCDGDGSDDLEQLSHFFVLTGEADLILGNRRATSAGRAALTLVQNFGNALATGLIRWGWGYAYHDLGPLRLVRRSCLDRMEMRDRSFGWTVEMQAKAAEMGLTIREIPVRYHFRKAGCSKISGTIRGSFQAGYIILSTLGRLYRQKTQESSDRLCPWLSSFLLLLGAILIVPYGDFQVAGVVPRFWVGIGVMSAGFVLSWTLRSIGGLWFWSMALLTRAILLWMYPGDDIWRYLWEGYIQNLGFSPYDLSPDAPDLPPYRTDWWRSINHLDTSAIYPPLAQLAFRALALFGPSVFIFKLSFVIADLGICWLLSRAWGFSRTLLYAWNPLVIYSFAGGGHYDSWFILPLVAGWLAYDRGRKFTSAFLIGVSVAIKWVSLPVLAFSLGQNRWHRGFFVVLLGILPLFLTALQFCHGGKCPLIPTSSLFVSRGRSAEFIPHLVGIIWPLSSQHNWIFAIPLGGSILLLSIVCRNFTSFLEGYFFSLLTLSPVVHAWYFTWLIPFSVVTRNLGTRWVSLSAFIYFVLKERQALGDSSWTLTPIERYGIWLPFLFGFLQTIKRQWQNRVETVARRTIMDGG